MKDILDLPATEVTMALLRTPLETAVRETFSSWNAAQVAPVAHDAASPDSTAKPVARVPPLKDRLDVKLFDPSGQESGWDIILLHYRIEGPLGTIIAEQHKTYYSQLFRCLWKMQRTSFVTKTIWSELMNAKKTHTEMPEMAVLTRDVLSLVSAMMHMTKEIYFFLSLEVSWRPSIYLNGQTVLFKFRSLV